MDDQAGDPLHKQLIDAASQWMLSKGLVKETVSQILPGGARIEIVINVTAAGDDGSGEGPDDAVVHPASWI